MVQVIPSRAYPAGTTPFGPFTIPGGLSQLNLALLRASWPSSNGAEIVSITAEVSFDNGATWPDKMSFGTAGGTLPVNPKTGVAPTSSSARWPIVTPCQIRGAITFAQPLTTTITLTIT